MSEPTPIGKHRFRVAKRLEEPSKFAVMRENEGLRAAAVSMRQLLAALMMELPENVEAISYKTADLECINPEMVEVELTATDCIVRLVVPPEPGAEPVPEEPEPVPEPEIA